MHTPYPLGIKGKTDIRIAATPTSLSAPVPDFSDISSAKLKSSEDEKVTIMAALEKVRFSLDADINHWLQQKEGVQLKPKHAVSGADISADLAWAKAQGADVLLAVDVAGYGRVKRKWILLMAGSGLVEGVAQGVATASVTGNALLGAGVAAEEVASESLTWIGGSWLWNKYLAPVTLEGRMWRVSDGRLIWHDIQFSDSSDLLAILFGKETPAKEDVLQASLKEAEDDLFNDLDRYLDKQVFFAGKGRK